MYNIGKAYEHPMGYGNLDPPIRRRLVSEETGSPISLAGATVTFTMTAMDGTVKIDAAVCAVETPAADGLFRYDWTLGDTDTRGKFEGRFTITLSSARPVDAPNDGYIVIPIT